MWERIPVAAGPLATVRDAAGFIVGEFDHLQCSHHCMCKLPALASGSKSASPARRATTQGQCPHFCWGLADVRCNWFACRQSMSEFVWTARGKISSRSSRPVHELRESVQLCYRWQTLQQQQQQQQLRHASLCFVLVTCNLCRKWMPPATLETLYWKHLLFLENFWCETSEKTQEGWNLRSRNSVPLCFPLLYVYAAKWRLWGCHHVKCWRALARDAAGCETSSKQSTRLSFLEFHILYLIR